MKENWCAVLCYAMLCCDLLLVLCNVSEKCYMKNAGASGTSSKSSSPSEQQKQTHHDQSRNRSGSDQLSPPCSDNHSDGGPSWLEKVLSHH